MMKLKAMYTCVSSKRESNDSPYETSDTKNYQTKKLTKASKRNAFRCKLLSFNSLKTTETPPKSPRKLEPPPSLTSMNIMELEKQTENKKVFKIPDDVFINNNSSDGISKPKTNSVSSLQNGCQRYESPKVEKRKTGQRSYTVTGVIEKDLMEKSLRLNSVIFDDLSSSRDDVFTVSTPTWNQGDNAWDEKTNSNSGNFKATSNNLLQKFTFKKSSREATDSSENLLSLSKNDSFEDLINRRTKREFDERTDSLSSLSSLSSVSLARTSVDRASESFDTIRAICERERLDRKQNFPQRNRSVPAIPQRAFSASPTIKESNWSDIPPLVPPREPVRPAKLSTPQRHASSPSTTSIARKSPPMTKAANSFSCSTPLENQRRKFQSHSSTIAVFSALPDSQRNQSPVIRPILKDGKQESHTHYFLLEEDNEKPRRPARIKPDPMHAIPRPTSKHRLMSLNCHTGTPPPRPPPIPPYYSKHTLRDDRERTNSLPLPSDKTSKEVFRYPLPKRLTSLTGSAERVGEKSRRMPRCSAMSPGQMINALQSQVFGVTMEECQEALQKNDWSVSQSVKYLKIEQLLRTGYGSRENCREILQKTGWDLQSASLLLLEHHQQKQKSCE